jgi:putative component of membrane protein insertase Oxa1/YidC/SpoIIIJ protein YidD
MLHKTILYFLLISLYSLEGFSQSSTQVLILDSAHFNVVSKQESSTQAITKTSWYTLYKRNFSELLSGNCQFKNTCSEFMKEAIHEKGFSGFLLGLDRLTRCGTSDYVYYLLPTMIDSKTHTIIDPIYDHE